MRADGHTTLNIKQKAFIIIIQNMIHITGNAKTPVKSKFP